MVDFLYGTNWRRFVEEKCEKNAKIEYFWTKTHRVYWYRLSCTGTGMQWVTCTDTGQSCTDIGCSSSPIFAYFAPLSPVFLHRLFRDLKKRLMGVQIRMRLSQKRIVPRRLGEAIFVSYDYLLNH